MAKQPAKEPIPIDFETSLRELEAIVEGMERGEQPLEEALKQFERGMALARQCHSALQAAEQKVSQLTVDRNGEEQIEPLDPPADAPPQ